MLEPLDQSHLDFPALWDKFYGFESCCVLLIFFVFCFHSSGSLSWASVSYTKNCPDQNMFFLENMTFKWILIWQDNHRITLKDNYKRNSVLVWYSYVIIKVYIYSNVSVITLNQLFEYFGCHLWIETWRKRGHGDQIYTSDNAL